MSQSYNSNNINEENFILNNQQVPNININQKLRPNSAPFLSIANLNAIVNQGNLNNITESQIHYNSENISNSEGLISFAFKNNSNTSEFSMHNFSLNFNLEEGNDIRFGDESNILIPNEEIENQNIPNLNAEIININNNDNKIYNKMSDGEKVQSKKDEKEEPNKDQKRDEIENDQQNQKEIKKEDEKELEPQKRNEGKEQNPLEKELAFVKLERDRMKKEIVLIRKENNLLRKENDFFRKELNNKNKEFLKGPIKMKINPMKIKLGENNQINNPLNNNRTIKKYQNIFFSQSGMKKGEKKEGTQKIKFQNVIKNIDKFTFHGELKGKKKRKD